MFRQGDVLIERVKRLPKAVKPVARKDGRFVLAHGEMTGHAHMILESHVRMFRDASDEHRTFLEVLDSPCRVVHEEHAEVVLPPGTYRVTRQREYTPKKIHYVRD
ncbi:MAG: hypothetical protein N3D11_11870 [Candidatus Sumerlaeia bacterium]|nr:hypothetical protein [Candidatus Sumerlaeia bacterium]